jgi:hypothetical protein
VLVSNTLMPPSWNRTVILIARASRLSSSAGVRDGCCRGALGLSCGCHA